VAAARANGIRVAEAETTRRGRFRFGWEVHVAAVGAGGERADHPAGVGVASLLQLQAAARWPMRQIFRYAAGAEIFNLALVLSGLGNLQHRFAIQMPNHKTIKSLLLILNVFV